MTRRLGPFGDTQAVAANRAWSNWGQAQTFVPLTINTLTPTLYFSHTTPVLPAGWYEFKPFTFITGSTASTAIASTLIIDGVALPTVLTEAVVTGGGFLLAGAPAQDWTASTATHTFEFWFSKPAGPGPATVTSLVGSFIWERKA